MIEKLREKTNEIIKAKNTVIEPKKNLILMIVISVVLAAIFGTAYFFVHSWELLFIALVVPTALIFSSIYAFLKEKRQDRGAEKDKQEFLSGSKYRQKEWKRSYYDYREKHKFETVSPKGMIYDLKRRYRKNNLMFIRLGALFSAVSVFILFCPVELKDKAIAVFGIVFGAILISAGIYDSVAGPVQKFIKRQTDLSEVEKSYMKGRMLSFKDNGINFGSDYTVIYSVKRVIAIKSDNIRDITRKMLRVKKYEDSLYSGQEYRYYIIIFYTDDNGNAGFTEVQLDEFQCEMIITEFNRRFYPERLYNDITSELTDNSISV